MRIALFALVPVALTFFTGGLGGETAEETAPAAVAAVPPKPDRTAAIDPALERQLQQMMSGYGLHRGAAVVIDVHSGALMAAAGHGASGPDRRIAFAPDFPSASLFKVVTAAGLLEQPTFDPSKCVTYRGGHRRVSTKLLKPRRGEKRCADLEAMLSKSVNVAIARSARRFLDHGALSAVASRMGFGHLFPSLAKAHQSTADLPADDDQRAIHAAGFGDHRLSPFHAAAMMAMIAKGGHWGVLKPKGVPEQALSPEVAKKLGAALLATTTRGTGRKVFRHRRDGVRQLAVAGKTGSLTVDGKDYSWFAGFAPANDPQVAFAAVVVNDPKKVWHIRGPHLARAALKAALWGVTPPRARDLLASR
jgi:peptidoglycan glycosyltransferase